MDKKLEKSQNPFRKLTGCGLSAVEIPKISLSEKRIDSRAAFLVVQDELIDERKARQNLATFCQTSMEEEAVRLMTETLQKNSIDKFEYPRTAELEQRCVNILADLWNVPPKNCFLGTSTIGSSEACMLGALAMKFRWQKKMEAEYGTHFITRKKPNLVISSGFQVCWKKFCTYWDVELREIPMKTGKMNLDAKSAVAACDEYTIGIVGILGITYTGFYDDIQDLDEKVCAHNRSVKNQISIHVDAASGGFFTPFTEPERRWDFRLENVVSINASGHKYGLVYPGVGWIVWKDRRFLPEKMIFDVNYLGGKVPGMGINFSRSASQIIGQYYNFVRFGREGYTEIHEHTRRVAQFLSSEIQKTGYFTILNDGSELPVVCYHLNNKVKIPWDLYELAERLLMRGWQVPTYPLPRDLEETVIHRYVCRADLSMNLAEHLVEDLQESIRELNEKKKFQNPKRTDVQGFTH
ncbi:MAG: glutamate decarboxylase [Planctomycetia bacterium]|nr:glutamate decarboxylase [Planctomycetia bacterium]